MCGGVCYYTTFFYYYIFFFGSLFFGNCCILHTFCCNLQRSCCILQHYSALQKVLYRSESSSSVATTREGGEFAVGDGDFAVFTAEINECLEHHGVRTGKVIFACIFVHSEVCVFLSFVGGVDIPLAGEVLFVVIS